MCGGLLALMLVLTGVITATIVPLMIKNRAVISKERNTQLRNEVMTTAHVDGGWSNWVDLPCSVSCGIDGRKIRLRRCNNLEPSTSGTFCQGERMDATSCGNMGDCT